MLQLLTIMRLTAYISGKVQRVGYRATVVSLAKDMGLVGFIQNRPDSRVLVIAEGESDSLEQFASALRIKNALIDVDDVSAEYSHASGQYANFKKVTGPGEVGKRLDDGIEILKELVVGVNGLVVGVNNLAIGLNNLTTITKDGFENLNGKMDQMLDKQDTSIEEIRGFRFDMKNHMDMRFKRIEADLAELKEMKAALKEKGIIG
jgi:acylphosphatase